MNTVKKFIPTICRTDLSILFCPFILKVNMLKNKIFLSNSEQGGPKKVEKIQK